MEMPGRRSNYTLLSQNPDDKFSSAGAGMTNYESHSGDNNKGKGDKGFDWDSSDHRMIQSQNRIATPGFPSPIGLQRQSSGSSFGESSISGDYYIPSLSNPDASYGQLNDSGGELRLVGGGSSSSKSWAQQTEESYQLQLALALRLSSEARCADDPHFLDPVPSHLTASAESMSHRFWVNGCLSYSDKVPDGFYSIHGMDPYVWIVCSELQESGRIPSIPSLKAADPTILHSVEAILIDKHSDSILKDLHYRVRTMSSSCITTEEVVEELAKLVCNHMGGAASSGEDDLVPIWKECRDDLKDCLASVVIPVGSLYAGLCRHRALLFKVLADAIDLPCRIAKGCKYCDRVDASTCLVRFGSDREYLVDLAGRPGYLCEPDSSLNGPSSILISSPLCFPRFRHVETSTVFSSLAKQYFSDSESLHFVFDETSTGTTTDGDLSAPMCAKQMDMTYIDRTSCVPSSSNQDDISRLPLPPTIARRRVRDKESQYTEMYNPSNVFIPPNIGKDTNPHIVHSDPRHDNHLVSSKPGKDFALDVEDLDIPWTDLVLKEKIGAGSFGTVLRADWNGSEVAVKILMEQDFHPERLQDFLREVAIMKRLRHPNIVLFMGAVTQPPNLSIVTEYLSRGSLYRLLHKHGEMLDERRRLCMAYDVAKGMNYLHKHNPPIVHRDLKSPNLLVDTKYTVKVCDFGLSRLKAHTFLSSKSAAGTPEWMAPEVLRDEPSNEKSDVYSFGVILWELATLQQPWSNLNPAQVVAAVGFKHKRLELPRDLNAQVAKVIEACWASEPWKRPSFATIMDMLRPLIKPATIPVSGPTDSQLLTRMHEIF
ncbi:unnamed protein product [Cuscuta europaea]|uniref:non-specific serine/threonine protein kinase n=1 Tax=Cuscuta europaea TaxID=41803 RepID=A0A9P1EP26_CUSEU|nr:unnamed protein product [Cuscuta europaea]